MDASILVVGKLENNMEKVHFTHLQGRRRRVSGRMASEKDGLYLMRKLTMIKMR